jgi:hypothetical protein
MFRIFPFFHLGAKRWARWRWDVRTAFTLQWIRKVLSSFSTFVSLFTFMLSFISPLLNLKLFWYSPFFYICLLFSICITFISYVIIYFTFKLCHFLHFIFFCFYIFFFCYRSLLFLSLSLCFLFLFTCFYFFVSLNSYASLVYFYHRRFFILSSLSSPIPSHHPNTFPAHESRSREGKCNQSFAIRFGPRQNQSETKNR